MKFRKEKAIEAADMWRWCMGGLFGVTDGTDGRRTCSGDLSADPFWPFVHRHCTFWFGWNRSYKGGDKETGKTAQLPLIIRNLIFIMCALFGRMGWVNRCHVAQITARQYLIIRWKKYDREERQRAHRVMGQSQIEPRSRDENLLRGLHGFEYFEINSSLSPHHFDLDRTPSFLTTL